MHPDEYAKMYDQEGHYWWFQGRKSIITSLLEGFDALGPDSRVIDLGCGTGLMLDYLQEHYRACGIDYSPLALQFCRRRGTRRLLRAGVEALPLESNGIDLALALDLAEHVRDDSAFMGEVFRVLRPGGRLLLTVPAHPFLWSDHDEALYHQRRYGRTDLRCLVDSAGFKTERLTYCITITFPMIVCFRVLQRIKQKFLGRRSAVKTHLIMLPGCLNGLLRWSVQLENSWLRRWNLPFGVTLLAVVRKP